MLRIGTKLGIGNGVLVAMCVIIGAVSYRQTQSVRQKVEEVTRVREPLNTAVYAFQNNLMQSAFATLGYLSTGDSALLATVYGNREQLRQIQRRFAEAEGGAGDSAIASGLSRGFGRVHDIAAEQITLRDLQNRAMRSLLRDLNAMDDLLAERIQTSLSSRDPVAYSRLQAVLEMKANVNGITRGLGTFLVTGDPQFEQGIQQAEDNFEHYYALYQNFLISSDEKRWSAELRRLSTRSLAQAKAIVALDKERRQHQAEFLAACRELGTMLDERMLQRTEQSLSEAKTDLLQAGERANASILIALVLTVAFGLGAGYIATRSITGPIRQLSSAMAAITRGDRAQKVTLATGDELQSLGDAFNLMTGQLLQANEGLRAEITRRRATEQGMRMLAQTITSMHESVVITDDNDTILSVNPAFCDTYGYRGEECIGLSTRALGLWVDFPSSTDQQSSTLRPGGWTGELQAARKNGETFPVLVSTSVVRDDLGSPKALVTLSRDITEQKRLQAMLEAAERERLAALRQFALSVQRAQEDERSRISRELHDDLCQRLSGMKFRVEVLEDQVMPADKRARRRLRDFARELDRTIVDVRRISSNLRPSVLDDFGLVIALKMLCRDFGKTHSLRTAFQSDPALPRRLDPSVEIALYRIAQEALSNVARHAGASTATLRLLCEETRLRLIVADDGKGFTRESAVRARTTGHGFGLISMRERTELLGGTFEVDAGEGRGTTVTCILPIGGCSDYEENQDTDRR
jgi:PAS domain S-box-containing protein